MTQFFWLCPGRPFESEFIPQVDVSLPAPDSQSKVDAHYQALNLRLQPAFFAQPRSGVNLIKLALDLDLQRTLGSENDSIVTIGASDTLPSTSDSGRFRLAQSYLLLVDDYFALTVGLVRSHFGLGTLANSGQAPPFHSIESGPHGFRQGGDRLWRAQVVGFPFGLIHEKETLGCHLLS